MSPGGKDRNAGAAAELDRFADLEAVYPFMDPSFSASSETHIACSGMLCDRLCRLHRLDRIAGSHNDYVRKRAHYRDILRCVMAHSKRAVCKSAADTDDLDVGVMVSGVVAYLFQAAKRGEVTDRIGEDRLPGKRHARCYTRHVLFGNAAVGESVRELLPKWFQNSESQICGDELNVLILFGKLNQCFYKCISHRRSFLTASCVPGRCCRVLPLPAAFFQDNRCSMSL